MRHFTTAAYLNDIYMGQQQFPICDTNIITNGLLENMESCAIFASTLKRSVQTVEFVMSKYNATNFEISYFDELIERGLGDFEGKNKKIVKQNSEYFINGKLVVTKTPPNGESLADLRRRVDSILWNLMDKIKEKNILVVSHLQTLRMIKFCMENSYDYDKWHEINYSHGEVVKENYGEKQQ